MEDALPVLRRLWAGEVVSHEGPAGSFADVSVSPQPAQDPFDVWLGGNVPAALDRCGRLADGWLPAFCTPADAAAGKAVIDGWPRQHGRAISPEHFGVSLAYAPEGTDLGALASSPLARRARGRPLEEIIPVGRGGLRSMLERFLEVGFSKFVVRPMAPPGEWPRRTGAVGRRGGRPADVTGAAAPTPTLPAMPERPLTLMAVHAHPDDEAISTGGILARYSAEGVRTVLVTCTNGELGDAPGGIKPGEPGHDESVVVPLRRKRARGQLRGPGRLRTWSSSATTTRAWRAGRRTTRPTASGGHRWPWPASRLAALMRTYEPQVVVTYDENGFYGHPDHIQANRVTHAAIAECGIPAKLYYTAMARSRLHGFRDIMAEAGMELPEEVQENPDFGTPDELITTTVDCSAFTEQKYASLAAHASQSDNIFFLKMGEDVFGSHHGIGELRAGAGLDRGAGARGRSVRRAPLSRSDPEPGLRPTGREGTQGPVRCGPYVALPAGVVPARARGTDPTRHSAAAAISTTTASISIVKASLAKGASHESLKPNSPTATDRRKPAMVVRANPIPMTAAQSRRTATTPMPMTSPAIDCSRKRGPMVGMVR